jgi:fibro-slime domain-containing protein
LGGAVNTGGTNVGGLVSQGGSNTAAGDTAAGGANPAGGQLATGGVNTPGGSGSLIVGTTAPGGQVSTGGVPNVGGASAGVGGSTGGTPPTTGGAPPNTCGNGTVEGTEGCDPAVHDNNFADGCTPLCKVEPDCPAIGGGCTTRCGDGFVLDAEKCDDGNTVSGDGCSSTCEIEPDFDCVQPEPGDSIIVPMVVRDFNKGGDFEKDFVGLEYANQGLLKPALNDHGKPELAFTTGTYYGVAGRTSGIASAESFARWYDDAATSTVNTYHATMATTLKLYQVAPGVYVNRYGANGEPWIRESLAAANWCGSVGSEVLDADGKPIPCTYCPGDNLNTPECDYPFAIPCDDRTNFLRCEVSGSSYHGIYAEAILDGTPVFFPADGMTPANPSSSAKLPPYYAGYWIDEPNTPKHNFSFTTEVRFWFKYDASKTLKLDFIGDDDAWVFINKKLALDVGGIHTPIEGYLSVATDGTAKASVSTTDPSYTRDTVTTNVSLGLEDGKLYEVAVFQAERQTTASSYLLSFSGFNTAPSVCTHK